MCVVGLGHGRQLEDGATMILCDAKQVLVQIGLSGTQQRADLSRVEIVEDGFATERRKNSTRGLVTTSMIL